MNVGKLIFAAALLLPNGMDACKCLASRTICEGVDDADVVLRAVLVSSADTEGDSFYADTVLKVVEVFKSEPGLEKFAVDEEIQVFTPGSTNSCKSSREIGEEYLFDFSRIQDNAFRSDGLYTGNSCDIFTNGGTWASVSEDDEESLRTCTCDGACDTFQECLPNESGYSVYGGSAEYYCGDVCVPTPCNDEEVCELLDVPCAEETFCPSLAVCEPATPEPTPAPTPDPEPCVRVDFSAWWPCGLGESAFPAPCEQASVVFFVRRDVGCTSSNAILTLDYTGPIAMASTLAGDDNTEISGDVSDDQTSVMFDIGQSGLDPSFGELGYSWYVKLGLDNCDTGYTWDDNFFQLTYVDDEQNIIDLSDFEDATLTDLDEEGGLTLNGDDGICPTPSPVIDVTPAPTTPADDGNVSDQCVGISNANWYQCGAAFRDTPESCSQALLSFIIRRENSDCIASNPIVTVDFAGPIVIDGSVDGVNEEISGDVSDDKTSVVFDTTTTPDLGPAWVPIGESYLWYFRFYVDNCDTGFTYSDNFFQVSYADDEANVIDLSGFETPDDIFAPSNGICPDDEMPLSFSFEEWNDDDE